MSTRTIPQNARLKMQPTVLAVPLSNGRLALHRGTRQTATNLVFEDLSGWRTAALKLLNGLRTLDEIRAELDGEGHQVGGDEFLAFLTELYVERAITDADTLDLEGLRADEIERYSRNLNGWGALSWGGKSAGQFQRELSQSHVLMLGVGGLGSCASLALAMAGCGRLTLVDFDFVELSNLNRQLYTIGDIGASKVDVMRKRLLATNPDVAVSGLGVRLRGPDHMLEILGAHKPDIVVAALDRPTIAADRWVNDACFAMGIPFVCNSVSAATGLLWTKVPGATGCFACDELWAKAKNPDHYEVRQFREQHDLIPATSAFSFGAMTIGGMITSDVIRHLVGWSMASAGRLVSLDFATLQTTIVEKPAHADCPVCGERTMRRSA